jgi:hypothetical protein
MEGSRRYAAVREPEAVLQSISQLSHRGGDFCLLHTAAFEEIGQRETALCHKLGKFRCSYDGTVNVKSVHMTLSCAI